MRMEDDSKLVASVTSVVREVDQETVARFGRPPVIETSDWVRDMLLPKLSPGLIPRRETGEPINAAELTRIVEAADKAFEVEGGGTRHWVRDHFLPELEDAGFRISRA